MPVREALIAAVAIVMMAPAIAEEANLKYALECGAANDQPPLSGPGGMLV
jgi:hypothetical protein